MTPQQRAQVEAMLKARMGGAPRTSTTKSCLTSESFKNAMAMGQQNENCTQKSDLKSSSSILQSIHMECTQGKNEYMAGDMTIEQRSSAEAR